MFLAKASNITVNGNETKTIISETDIDSQSLVVVRIKANYAMTFKLYLYDTDFDENDPYYTKTLTANKTLTVSIGERFRFLRVLVTNSDTNPHKVILCTVRGRGGQ